MKTIFVSVLQAVQAKNILRTGIYRRLIAEPDLKVVLLVGSPEHARYYGAEFSHPRLVYEVIAPYRPRGLDRLFAGLKFLLIRSETFDLRRRMRLEDEGGYVRYGVSWLSNRVFARRSVRRTARFLDRLLVRRTPFGPLFERYHPDAVMLAHLFDDAEIAILREARRRAVPVIGFVNSWDKLTGRAMLRLLPDKLIVFNGIVREEAVRFADMDGRDIFVGGLPHYDRYVTNRPSPRGEFCRAFGIPPEHHILVYAPNGKYSAKADGPLIDFLQEAITSGRISNASLLVRFQPNDRVDMAEVERRPWLHYDIPGKRFSSERGVDWDMDERDTQRLIDTLAHAAVFLCYTSSLSVDAAVFDKPVININFELVPIAKRADSPIHYYCMEHYRKAVESGGIRVVSSPHDLIEWVNRYLAHPETDGEGRRRLVARQCGAMDGRAGERIAEFFLAAL